jgi:hypothetical protein
MRFPTREAFVVGAAFAVALGCEGAPLDPRYPSQPPDCAVQVFEGRPSMPVDELGTIALSGYWRQTMAQVCRRGGDVVWGLKDGRAAARGTGRGTVSLVPQIEVGHTRVASN